MGRVKAAAMTAAAAVMAVLTAGGAAGALPTPERVSFRSLDRDASGEPVRIAALLYRPEGPAPSGGFPAVIVLHGCGGMYSALPGRADQLSRHNAAWTADLLGEGYAVLLPDSFNPRGQREVCTTAPASRTINAGRRRLDALGALAWLASRSGIDGERIALVGFSHGGSTTLAAINARDRAVIAFRDVPDAPRFFRAAVAFYPGCRAYADAGERWEPAVPAQVHIGASDDWTPAAPCVALGEARKARGEPFDVTVYPGSHHGFDSPGGRLVVRQDVPGGVNPGRGVTVGANVETGAAARRSTRAFLREMLHPGAVGNLDKVRAAR
jgi:dienelactone hydrolase